MAGEPAVPWERLDRRAVARAALTALGIPVLSVIPLGIAFADRGTGLLGTAAIGLALWAIAVAVICTWEALRRATTWFRVTDERVELRTELIAHRRRSLRRERIRTVDLSAGPTHRLLGLAKVEIGTAQDAGSGGDRLRIDPVARERAEALRHQLLRREGGVAAATPEPTTESQLARLDPAWIRYAPLSFATLALGVAAAGALWQGSQLVGLDDDLSRGAWDAAHAWLAVGGVALGLLLAGTVGSLAVFVEQWFGYRLARERDGTLLLRRGLLTTRSLTLEERRLRGVELVEPLALRLAGAARVEAVATGMGKGDSDARAQHATLLPPAPRPLALGVAADVLAPSAGPAPPAEAAVAPARGAAVAPPAPPAHGAAVAPPVSPARGAAVAPPVPPARGAAAAPLLSPLAAPLRPHPLAARRRRLVRALAVLAAAVAVPLVFAIALADPELLPVAAGVALVGAPPALWLARDAYRSLGHALTARHLVVRQGSLRRGTVALERGGVIGWTVTRSPLQRRAGLATITATSAAGRGAYAILDADAEEGLTFADTATPGLLAQFSE